MQHKCTKNEKLIKELEDNWHKEQKKMVSYWESNIHQVLWMEVLQCLLLFLTHNSNLFTPWLKANALFAITNDVILFLQNDAEAEMKSAQHKYYLTCQDLSRVSSKTHFLLLKGM